MKINELIYKEISHRKINFILSILAVIVAVGVLVSQVTLLKIHDLKTQDILAQKQAEMEESMRVMEDDYRKIMKMLGFNLLILPKDQDLNDFYSRGVLTSSMPESYADKLADMKLMSMRHLLPGIEKRVQWPEQNNRTIILSGVKGELGEGMKEKKEPILEPVPEGTAVLGHAICSQIGLETGDDFTLSGKELRVSRCNPERGSKDDITIWINLSEAQQVLGMEGRINVIQALKCHCHGSDLPSIRKQVEEILPNTQVIEFSSRVVTRAEARDCAKAVAKASLESERVNRLRLRQEKESFALWLVPFVLFGSVFLIGALTFINTRERQGEVAILRALGVRSNQILLAFLTKATLVGIIGAILGYLSGLTAGIISDPGVLSGNKMWVEIINPVLLITSLVLAPLLSVIAAWLPALYAAGQDPAAILREE